MIGIIGSLVLALFLFVDFDLYKAEMRQTYGHVGLLHEVVDHVIFPIVVLLIPVALATRRLLSRSLEPLVTASELISHATGKDRGFRVDASQMPVEALPFVEAINELLMRLDQSAQRQEMFAADVAHELKSGLSAVMLELDGMDTDSARRAIDDIKAMNRLIEQLLVLARLDAYAAAPQPLVHVRLPDAALDAVRLIAPTALKQGVTLALADENSSGVLAQAAPVTAVLRNLIENAVRVTPAGGEVAVICGPGPRVRVVDGGPGISSEQLTALCNRFQRADRASEEGAGLGLSIVARVMEVYDGRLETDPTEPSITVVFPEGSRID